MAKEPIAIPEALEYEPGYSKAVKAGNTVYVGATTGINVTTGEFAGLTMKEWYRASEMHVVGSGDRFPRPWGGLRPS